MSDRSWIIFGPDLEPLEAEARRSASASGARPDGLIVTGDAGDVARTLAEASGGWCELQTAPDNGDAPQPVHVQVHHVRFVTPAPSD